MSQAKPPLVLVGSVREKLEALADFYKIDRTAMWSMTVLEFAEKVQAARWRQS